MNDDRQYLRPRPETVIMQQLSYVYLDNGHRTLRLGRGAYTLMRDSSCSGDGYRVSDEFFERCESEALSRKAFEAAEVWPPTLKE